METITGIVQKGRRRGSDLGYPTINIPLEGGAFSGIYAGRVYLRDEAPYVAAIFADPSRATLEAHLLDFSDDLYGLEVKIELHKKLRESAAYGSDEELARAIAQDVANVRKYFILRG